MTPKSRPQKTKSGVFKSYLIPVIDAVGNDDVIVVGVRGYYRDSMGAKGKNDRGMYDDAVFIYTPDHFSSYNANTDPSRSGFNANVGKGYAVLDAGVWRYKIGQHGVSKGKPYRACVQAQSVGVTRDGGKKETGWFGINIHRGGRNGTSSEGCQTIVPQQWEEFISTLSEQLKIYAQQTFAYVLAEEN